MTIYGLDFVKSKDGRYFLVELNGINSGMEGFKKIYGDDRVRQTAIEMLYEKHPKLTYNVGSYSEKKWIEDNPKKVKLRSFFQRNEWAKRPLALALEPIIRIMQPVWRDSELAEKDFVTQSNKLDDTIEEDLWPKIYGIPEYDGEKSTVINLHNEILPHPLVNPYMSEEITKNKFFQYILLNNPQLKKNLPHTTLVGLGITDESAIEILSNQWNKFVVKPMIGLQGLGVKVISREQLRDKYVGSSGPLSKKYDRLTLDVAIDHRSPVMLEDLVRSGNFEFENWLSVVQPFIDSRTSKRSKYRSIRAIVCNGKFVDAYARVSDTRIVNLARGADAEPFNHDDRFRKLCERTVECLDQATPKCENPKPLKTYIYNSYMSKTRERNEEFGIVQNPNDNFLENNSFLNSYAMFYPALLNYTINIIASNMKRL